MTITREQILEVLDRCKSLGENADAVMALITPPDPVTEKHIGMLCEFSMRSNSNRKHYALLDSIGNNMFITHEGYSFDCALLHIGFHGNPHDGSDKCPCEDKPVNVLHKNGRIQAGDFPNDLPWENVVKWAYCEDMKS